MDRNKRFEYFGDYYGCFFGFRLTELYVLLGIRKQSVVIDNILLQN